MLGIVTSTQQNRKQVESSSDYRCVLPRTCTPLSHFFVVSYSYYFKVAQIVRPLSITILIKNGDFARFQLVCDGLMDGRTETDRELI